MGVTIVGNTTTFDGTGELTQAIVAEGISTATRVIIKGYTSIGNSAFDGSIALTSIWISDSVTYLDAGAFINCKGLTSISIPASVTYIGFSAFRSCIGLTSVSIPADSQLTSIVNNAFRNTALTSISIPASVTSIGNYAFAQCYALTTVYIQNGVLGVQSPGNGYFFWSPNPVNFLLPIPAPSLSNFSIQSKTYGEPSFAITPPASNNTTVGFTYESLTPLIATIEGNIITIVGPGQATITATQAATPNYLSGTIQTTFTVNQSTQTNPTNISTAGALEYFLNSTTAKYANIASTLQISTKLHSLMSEKKLFTTQNNVKISHA